MVIGDLQNKYLVGDTCSPPSSTKTLKYLLLCEVNHKATVHQLDFIGPLLQAKFINRVFVKLDSRYADYFQGYSNYYERDLRLLNYKYGMTKSGDLFSDSLTEWLLETVFIQYQCQMSI